MAHKTLISGTACAVKGGRDLIAGTGYAKKQGKTLIDGTLFTVPFSKGIPLSTITPGAILYLNESGSPVPFYVCKHDYESGLNGAGRTLLVRKDCYDKRAFNSNNNAFSGSSIDTWLNNTWLKLLDADIQAAISKTKFYYTTGNDNNTVSTLQRAVFLLSLTELGKSSDSANTEGTALDSVVCMRLAIAHYDGNATVQWTRTPMKRNTFYVFCLSTDGGLDRRIRSNSDSSRPTFTLPNTFPVIQNPDGTYSPAA